MELWRKYLSIRKGACMVKHLMWIYSNRKIGKAISCQSSSVLRVCWKCHNNLLTICKSQSLGFFFFFLAFVKRNVIGFKWIEMWDFKGIYIIFLCLAWKGSTSDFYWNLSLKKRHLGAIEIIFAFLPFTLTAENSNV